MADNRKKRTMWILVAVIGTALAILVALNLTSRGKPVDHEIRHLYPAGDSQFVRSMGTLLGPALLPGNRVTALINGDEIFPAMLEAIREGQRTINFETYIYWSGTIGRQFAEALSERARAGLEVRVLLDWVGTGKMDDATMGAMKRAGVTVVKYRPLRWYTVARLNNRTHRKLLVVDGKVGFTGGVGIADKWLGDAQDPEHWRDSHFRVEGPVVAQMQATFMENWMETQARVLHSEEHFPPLDSVGFQHAQVFHSSAGSGSESVRLMYLLSIAAATQSVRLSASYFVPDSLAIETLVSARRRGVKIEIIVPGTDIDAEVVRRASRSLWGPLLEAGIEIYEYQPTMYHTKVLIVDDVWVSVGSTNFDNRSFRLNDEANLNILDAEFARSQSVVFERDKTRSRRVTLELWRRRPWTEKVKEWAASLVQSQL